MSSALMNAARILAGVAGVEELRIKTELCEAADDATRHGRHTQSCVCVTCETYDAALQAYREWKETQQ